MSSTTREAGPGSYLERRAALLRRPGPPGPGRRREMSALADAWLADLFGAATPPDQVGLALLAVGGFGRGELSPGSDLDVVLLHDRHPDAVSVAEQLWYPVWDAGVRLDHAVRTPVQARRLAGEDMAVLLGLLSLRLIAGDRRLAADLRSAVLADWRGAARRRLPELRALCAERAERSGDVAHALEPDLKSGRGGLRDVVALRAVAASWVADRPHGALDASAAQLLDVRDALHAVTGRPGDRLVLQEQEAVAARLELPGPDALLESVAGAARAVSHAADVTWRSVDRVLAAPRRSRWSAGRLSRPVPLEPGLAEYDGQVVVAPGTPLRDDPVLAVRAAALAAQRGLALEPVTVTRLNAVVPPLPEPWPPAARDAFVALLGAGPGMVGVWETLDQTGVLARLLPEWRLVRYRPQRNALHRFTVDRHLVEAVLHAAARRRRVNRPDLLLIATLLHDLGRGLPGDHCEAGAAAASQVVRRMGFPAEDVETVHLLVRHHLLLGEVATRRDLDDPATAELVAAAVPTAAALDLLHVLTVADGLATGPAVGSEWRTGLVDALVARVRARLAGAPPLAPRPQPAERLREAARPLGPDGVGVGVRTEDGGYTVTVVAPDRKGLMAGVAGVLALHRLSVRSADLRTEGGTALDEWRVVPEYGDPPARDALREDVRRVLAGRYDVGAVLARREAGRARPLRRLAGGLGGDAGARDGGTSERLPPQVDVVPDASEAATVLEVRAADRLGLLHQLGAALAVAGVVVRAARVTTLGAEAVDVFYVVDGSGRPLAPERARVVADLLGEAAR